MLSRTNCWKPHWLRTCKRASRIILLMLGVSISLLMEPSAQAGYAAYVVDANSGAVLHARNSQVLNFPASLCKVMTLYLVFKGLDDRAFSLKSMVPISQRASRQPSSKIGLKAGDSIMLQDAILALTTKSANDIATAVAEFISGSEPAFAKQMTKQAQSLGMSKTSFRNASGLPNSRQKTTAKDLSVLGVALYANFPHYGHYFSHKNFSYRGRTYRNHNNLLGMYKGVKGIKTGYIRAAGYNLMISARDNGNHVIAVVLGGKTAKRRDAQMRRLLDQAFIRIERNNKLFAVVSRPPRKPTIKTAVNEYPLKTVRKNLANPADIIGEVLTEYVAVNDAMAAQSHDRTWGVQLGAFSRHDAAERVLNSVAPLFPELLGNTQPEVSTVTDSVGTLYRARYIGLTEAAARALCSKLTGRSQACIISPPSPSS
ncbi:MAG TPA: D-alanyl-D-alanine carboxypeptidase [Alphaproteobacteria bacterium]|nr:D-alanyl-D-alanine carboxypeptidase [Alphaproteobacteria bacterium]